jgi:drug/metabolite transporter (DMT)-like permease
MVYCSVAYTAILGWKFMGESLGALKFTAIALCLCGCALISGALNASAWQSNLLGVVAGLLTGLCYTAYSLMGRVTSKRGISPWTTLLYIFAFAGTFLFLANLTGGWLPGSATTPKDMFWLGASVEGWTVMILLGAIPTVGGYGFYKFAGHSKTVRSKETEKAGRAVYLCIHKRSGFFTDAADRRFGASC